MFRRGNDFRKSRASTMHPVPIEDKNALKISSVFSVELSEKLVQAKFLL